MAIVVRIWFDGDPDNDPPIIELSGDSDIVNDTIKQTDKDSQELVATKEICAKAQSIIMQQFRDCQKIEEKEKRIVVLQAELDELNAVTLPKLDATKLDAIVKG